MTSAAPEYVGTVGKRLSWIRVGKSQPARAAELGVHTNTYARWERDEAAISAEGLAALIRDGWNANWLLTGEGPERLDAAYPQGPTETNSRVGEPGLSQPLRVDLLTMAVELIDSELARAGRILPLEKRALAYSLVYEELLEPGDELPTAKILKLVLRAV